MPGPGHPRLQNANRPGEDQHDKTSICRPRSALQGRRSGDVDRAEAPLFFGRLLTRLDGTKLSPNESAAGPATVFVNPDKQSRPAWVGLIVGERLMLEIGFESLTALFAVSRSQAFRERTRGRV